MRNRVFWTVAGAGVLAASIVIAQPGKDAKKPANHQKPATPAHAPAAGQPEFELPPGMTQEDMQACMEAGTPGEMHAWLAEGVGEWEGTTKMWMAPDTEPTVSECTSTVTTMLDGRFIQCEIAGDMPGMGPFNGFGVYGFDNVSQQFQSTWMDNCGTGMMTGTGELSSDKKTLTWTFTYNCPMTKKPTIMREVERRTSKDSMTLEMYGTPPHGGKEYKMMEITFTRKAETAPMIGF